MYHRISSIVAINQVVAPLTQRHSLKAREMCHLCGKEQSELHKHLRNVHDISQEDMKQTVLKARENKARDRECSSWEKKFEEAIAKYWDLNARLINNPNKDAQKIKNKELSFGQSLMNIGRLFKKATGEDPMILLTM